MLIVGGRADLFEVESPSSKEQITGRYQVGYTSPIPVAGVKMDRASRCAYLVNEPGIENMKTDCVRMVVPVVNRAVNIAGGGGSRRRFNQYRVSINKTALAAIVKVTALLGRK